MKKIWFAMALAAAGMQVPGFAQLQADTTIVRRHLNELAGAKYNGRGYNKDGMFYAAQYIARTYSKLGLQSFGLDYYQPFEMPIVKYDGKMHVALNGVTLKAGEDYLVDPYSRSADYSNRRVAHMDLYAEIAGLEGAALAKRWEDIKDKLAGNSYVWVLHHADDFKKAMGWSGVRTWSANLPAGDYIIPVSDPPLWFVTQEFREPRIIYLYGAPARNADWINMVSARYEAELQTDFMARNVIGYVPARQASDRYIVFTAHYDHIGMMGQDAVFYGASDNASGTAMMLNLAAHYAANPLDNYNVMFIACAAEEAGLLGSRYYVEHPCFPLDKIRFLINLDIWGDASDGVAVVNGKKFEREFQKVLAANREISNSPEGYFRQIRQGEEAANSDHAPFYAKGVPAFFFFTIGGPGYYHNTRDQAATLKLTNINEAALLLKIFVNKLQED